MKTNFHTHHYLCKHAIGSCEEYAEQALKTGYNELGFSDHAPKDNVKILGLRMSEEEYTKYIKDVLYTKQKYKGKLSIFLGIEIEHWFTQQAYYQEILKELDYVILGQHVISMKNDDKSLISAFTLSTKKEILKYAETLCLAMRTKRYDIVAHPDLFLNGYTKFDETAKNVTEIICECAYQTKTILEYNANGYRRNYVKNNGKKIAPYPRKEFWEIAEKYQVTAILSMDAHSPEQLNDVVSHKAEEEFNNLSVNKIKSFTEIKAYRQGF